MCELSGKKCDRCENVQNPCRGDAKSLHLWLPVEHAFVKARQALQRLHADLEASEADLHLKVTLNGARIEETLSTVAEVMTAQESRDVRALETDKDGALGPADFPRVASLADLALRSQSQWLTDMLAEERVTHWFQPIVHCDEPSRIFAHEALLRGIERDGELISPGRMLPLARASDLLFPLDLISRRSAIRNACARGLESNLFINFSPAAIYDPKFCLRTTVREIESAGFDPSSVVFEVVESEQAADKSHLRNILDYYRDAGFKVALDDVGAGYSSLNMLHELRPDFVKLDMEMIRDVHTEDYKAVVVSKLLEIARDLGIETVGEGVETQDELAWLQAHGATYIQGYLIARPAADPLSRIDLAKAA